MPLKRKTGNRLHDNAEAYTQRNVQLLQNKYRSNIGGQGHLPLVNYVDVSTILLYTNSDLQICLFPDDDYAERFV